MSAMFVRWHYRQLHQRQKVTTETGFAHQTHFCCIAIEHAGKGLYVSNYLTGSVWLLWQSHTKDLASCSVLLFNTTDSNTWITTPLQQAPNYLEWKQYDPHSKFYEKYLWVSLSLSVCLSSVLLVYFLGWEFLNMQMWVVISHIRRRTKGGNAVPSPGTLQHV